MCTVVIQLHIYIYVHVNIFFFRFFSILGYYKNIDYSSLCYLVGPCCLSVLYIVVCTCYYNLGGSVVKKPPVSSEDERNESLIPGSGRCPGKGSGNPLQYSYLENFMNRGDWQATVHGVAKSQTQLSD